VVSGAEPSHCTIEIDVSDGQARLRVVNVGALLGLEPDLVVVAEAGTGDEASASVRRHRPDVAVLDVEMPGRDGVEVAQWVAANEPATRCIILTRHALPGVLRQGARCGRHRVRHEERPGHRAR
jgi:two-component system response regulator DesR